MTDVTECCLYLLLHTFHTWSLELCEYAEKHFPFLCGRMTPPSEKKKDIFLNFENDMCGMCVCVCLCVYIYCIIVINQNQNLLTY